MRERPKSWTRKYQKDPWNDLDVQLELHFSPSLQARWRKPPVVYESFEEIYPKLHAQKEPDEAP